MTGRKKIVLGAVIGVVLAVHVSLYAAGGTWRPMSLALLAVDVFSAWFVVGAVREFKKLDRKDDTD
jgi:hypothetical protein